MSDLVAQLTEALTGRYAIEREIGEGGMATVYLAQDVRHDRKVALKVLRPELAAIIGAERFLNEIRVTANLQHPHILPLHDSGEAGSFLFYVMPFVQGESLRQRMDRDKQLAVEEAVRITAQVASALDYAHREGVIHRDIKPENILLQDGNALVADFGIALAVSAAGGTRITETGLSLGTPNYMSPEQATADRELTARSDLYSLACMTYEMLVGDPPHLGSTAQAIIAKVVTEDPRPITNMRKAVPVHVEAAVMKALEKLPADRFESAAAFGEALQNPSFTHGTAARTAATSVVARSGASRASRVLWPAAALVGLGLAGSVGWWLKPPPAQPVARFTVLLPDDQQLAPYGGIVAVSPDGSEIIYEGFAGNLADIRLYRRKMNELRAVPIEGTNGVSPFLSPDGRTVGFVRASERALKTVSVEGGPPVTLAEDVFWNGADWGSDGYIYFSQRPAGGLSRVLSTGGDIESLAVPDTGRFFWPDALPGGRGVLLTIERRPLEQSEVAVLDLETREVRTLTTGTRGRYLDTGHLVYSRADGALFAAPFDESSLEITGPSSPLLEGISVGTAGSQFAVAGNGTLVYLTGFSGAEETLVWVDRSGREEPIPFPHDDIEDMAISPDGARIAVVVEEGDVEDVWVYDFATEIGTKLTFTGDNQMPFWTPEGTHVVFSSQRDGQPALWQKRWDGSGDAEILYAGAHPVWEGDFTPDGQWLVVREDAGESRDIRFIRLPSDSAESPLTTPFQEDSPRLSPDGRWLAYVSDESGADEVYVRAFPGPGGRWQVSNGGGFSPLWSRDGAEVFYRTRGSTGPFVSVQVGTESTFSLGSRAEMFSGNYESTQNHTSFDVSPDGERFVMVRIGSASEREMVVVLNWAEEVLERTGNE